MKEALKKNGGQVDEEVLEIGEDGMPVAKSRNATYWEKKRRNEMESSVLNKKKPELEKVDTVNSNQSK